MGFWFQITSCANFKLEKNHPLSPVSSDLELTLKQIWKIWREPRFPGIRYSAARVRYVQNSLRSADREDRICLVLNSVLALKLGIPLLPAFAKPLDTVVGIGVCCSREIGPFSHSLKILKSQLPPYRNVNSFKLSAGCRFGLQC